MCDTNMLPLTTFESDAGYDSTLRPKKETKTFFCNISYKTRAILTKFGRPFRK